MTGLHFERLESRGVVTVGGEDRNTFLQGLISNDIDRVSADRAIWAALLTPQGRVLVDFMISRTEDGFLIECDAGRADELFTRLRRYRLRRPIELTRETELAVWVIWGIDSPPAGARRDTRRDTRHPDLGWRMIAAQDAFAQDTCVDIAPAAIENWHRLRIAAAVPQGPVDLVPERALMLEAGLDRLGALDFQKGCYVGQEVTARTHYRGLVKRRIAPFAVTGAGCAPGATITSDDKALGTVLSTVCGPEGGMCLAAMKLSDLHRLQDSGDAVDIDGATARLALPDWMLPLPSPARTDSA